VNLDPVIGREQGGTRPVVVVSRDEINSKPLVVQVVPGTSGARVRNDYPWNARVPAGEGNLPRETVFLAFQARAVDQSRFPDVPHGTLSPGALAAVERALVCVFQLENIGPTP